MVLARLNGVAPCSIDMYLSAFPEMAEQFDTSAPRGRRGPPIIGTAACLLTSVGCAFAPTIELLVGLRFVQGTGSTVLGFLQYGMGAVAPPLVGLAGEHSALPMGVTPSEEQAPALSSR